MIILAALLLFFFIKGISALVRRTAGARNPQRPVHAPRRRIARAPRTTAAPVEEPVSAWTALDDLQLSRLLKDAAS